MDLKNIGILAMALVVGGLAAVLFRETPVVEEVVVSEYADQTLFTAKVHGEVAPGTIYTTAINQNLFESFLPTSTPYILEFANTGELLYIEEVDDIAIDHQMHANGLKTIGRFGGETRIKEGAYQLFDPVVGDVIELTVKDNENTDLHGLVKLQNGNYMLPSYKMHVVDGEKVQSFLIEEITPAGESVFVWDSIDHIALEERESAELRPYWLEENINDYFHGNSIAETNDNNVILSARHTNQVVKLSRETGEVMWKLGGKSSDFTFVDDPLGGFYHQHSATELENGNILIYDNGNLHENQQTRVVEYELDLETMTARLVWSYTDGRFTYATGSTQRLPNGNTLIGWGLEQTMSSTSPRITEVTSEGDVVLEIFYPDNAGFYNAFKL